MLPSTLARPELFYHKEGISICYEATSTCSVQLVTAVIWSAGIPDLPVPLPGYVLAQFIYECYRFLGFLNYDRIF